MITQIQLPIYIEEDLPEMKAALQKASLSESANVYTCTQCLADFTRNMVQQHNYNMVRRCFNLAAKLYTKGNGMVKNAVENVYVFSFSTLLNSCQTYRERNLVQSTMPGVLHKVYVKQLMTSGD